MPVVLLGSTFHSNVLFYLGAFFLNDRLWYRKVIMIVGAVALGGFFIEHFIQFPYATPAQIKALFCLGA